MYSRQLVFFCYIKIEGGNLGDLEIRDHSGELFHQKLSSPIIVAALQETVVEVASFILIAVSTGVRDDVW